MLVPERMGRILGRQLLGHKAKLDERTHSVLQKTVVDLVNIREVVNRPARAVLVVHAHFVEKNSVEADVLHLRHLLHLAQVLAIAFPQA